MLGMLKGCLQRFGLPKIPLVAVQPCWPLHIPILLRGFRTPKSMTKQNFLVNVHALVSIIALYVRLFCSFMSLGRLVCIQRTPKRRGSGSLRRRANGSLRDRANGSLRDRFLQKACRACMRVDMFAPRCMFIYAHARAGMRLFVLVGVYIA